MIEKILVIVIVTIVFGVILFVTVKEILKKKLEYYLNKNNKRKIKNRS